MPHSSPELIWQLVRNNHAFIKPGLHGEKFSSEPGNLYNKHSYKYSGIANRDTAIDITPDAALELGITLYKPRKRNAHKPSSAKQTVSLKKQYQRQVDAVTKEIQHIRPDLKKCAQRRVSAVHKAQVKYKAISSK